MSEAKKEFEVEVRKLLQTNFLSKGVRITDEAVTHIATHMPKYLQYIRNDTVILEKFIEWYVLGYVMGKVEATRELKQGTGKAFFD